MSRETVDLTASSQLAFPSQPAPAGQLSTVANDEFINIEEIDASQASQVTQKRRGRPPGSKDKQPRKKWAKTSTGEVQDAGNTREPGLEL
jgi:hypothetical protein